MCVCAEWGRVIIVEVEYKSLKIIRFQNHESFLVNGMTILDKKKIRINHNSVFSKSPTNTP